MFSVHCVEWAGITAPPCPPCVWVAWVLPVTLTQADANACCAVHDTVTWRAQWGGNSEGGARRIGDSTSEVLQCVWLLGCMCEGVCQRGGDARRCLLRNGQ